jgi:hypothetical protein
MLSKKNILQMVIKVIRNNFFKIFLFSVLIVISNNVVTPINSLEFQFKKKLMKTN